MTVGQRKKKEGGRLEMASGKYTLSRKVTHSFTFDVLFGLTAVAFAATQCQHVGHTFKKIVFTSGWNWIWNTERLCFLHTGNCPFPFQRSNKAALWIKFRIFFSLHQNHEITLPTAPQDQKVLSFFKTVCLHIVIKCWTDMCEVCASLRDLLKYCSLQLSALIVAGRCLEKSFHCPLSGSNGVAYFYFGN